MQRRFDSFPADVWALAAIAANSERIAAVRAHAPQGRKERSGKRYQRDGAVESHPLSAPLRLCGSFILRSSALICGSTFLVDSV
jgi:hypothetical protein